MKKMITIPHPGPIYGKGGIYGPITTPFLEDVSTIVTILMKGAPVIEHLPDGSTVQLDLTNVRVDHTKKVEKPRVPETKQEKQETPVQPPKQNHQQNNEKQQNTEKNKNISEDEITKK